jgi:uncharacterized protein (DUF488 family)
MKKSIIYTVGHSTHEISYFLELLKEYSVNCLVDVRSVAASRYNPQYNQKALVKSLQDNGIQYIHMPAEFGARHTDPALLNEEGQVDFIKVQNSAAFRSGVERLRVLINSGLTVALMCAEGDPLDCHRFSMISVALQRDGFDVYHIMKDQTVKTNAELEMQLLKKYKKKLSQPDIFNQPASRDQVKEAYRLRNKDIGFSPK